MDQEEVTVCTRCLKRGEECTLGGGTTKACVQCHQVKGHCSLVRKHPAIPSTPTQAHKQPRVSEAGLSRAGEVWEKEAEVADKEGSWGVRACKGIAHLSSSLEGLTDMIRWQNEILGHLVGIMEEEQVRAVWRWRMQGASVVVPVVVPVVILGESDEEEVRAGVEEGGGEEEEVRDEEE